MKQSAKAQLQQALAGIGSARAELGMRRAEMVNQALENYRQQVIQINARNTAFQQNIAQIRFETDQRIREAQAKATSITENLEKWSLSPSETQFLPGNQAQGITPGDYGAFTATDVGPYTAITGKPKDDLTEKIKNLNLGQ